MSEVLLPYRAGLDFTGLTWDLINGMLTLWACLLGVRRELRHYVHEVDVWQKLRRCEIRDWHRYGRHFNSAVRGARRVRRRELGTRWRPADLVVGRWVRRRLWPTLTLMGETTFPTYEQIATSLNEAMPTFTPEGSGAKGKSGTDDAKAIAEAIAKVVIEGQFKNTNVGCLLCRARVYYLEREPVQKAEIGGEKPGYESGKEWWNSQVPIPAIEPQNSQKFMLVRQSVYGIDATSGPHWRQKVTVGQQAGTVFRSTLHPTQAESKTLAEKLEAGKIFAASVFGGPIRFVDSEAEGSLPSFSNMLLVDRGIITQQPVNPGLVGVDARQICAHNQYSCATMVAGTTAEMKAYAEKKLSEVNEFGIAAYLPLQGNNDLNFICGGYTCYGHFMGIAASEHFVFDRLGLIYCYNSAVVIIYGKTAGGVQGESAQAVHGWKGSSISSEGCGNEGSHIVFLGMKEEAKSGMIVEFSLDVEVLHNTVDIKDAHNFAYGEIRWNNQSKGIEKISESNARLEGCKHLEVVNMYRAPGPVTAPTATELETTLTNPFQYPAWFTLVNCKEISIDGELITPIPASTVPITIRLRANGTIKCVKETGKTIESSKWFLGR